MDENRKTVLRLDGSYGLGDLIVITVLTADKVHGKIETTYEVPYAVVDAKVLTSALESKYILGYKLERYVPAGTKTVVLTTGEDGLRAEYDGDGQ